MNTSPGNAPQNRWWDRRVINISTKELGLGIAFIAMCAVFTAMSPVFFSVSNIKNILRQTSALFMLAGGQTLALLTGGIDLSQGAVVSLVSVVTAFFVIKLGFLPGLLAGLLTGAIFGLIIGLLVGKLRVQPFISSLGMMYVANGIALTTTGGAPVHGITSDAFFQIGGGFIGSIPIPAVLAIIVLVLLFQMLKRTRFGRHIYAVGGNEVAARMSGINTENCKIMVYTLGGVLVALGGIILTARVNSGQPLLGSDLTMQSLGATVIGGTSLTGGEGGVGRTLFGVLFIGAMTNGLNLLGINTFVQQLVIGALIITSVIISQQGRGFAQLNGLPWRRRRQAGQSTS